jgi:hypothetical protein
VEGILTRSKVTHTDFPFQPWHTYYDWNFYIRVDPQYTYLHSESNLRDHGGVIECEWDTAFLPSWAWPQDGDRIWVVGRWIYDCGHPEAHGHKTELHPPKAVASFRSEAVTFAGNRGSTRAQQAVLYIGRNGGYWRQPINDQDYAFDLYLPPKPYGEAEPRWTVVSQTGPLPVQPHITPFPAYAPRALRVVIPLKGVEPHPEAYGAIISGGWSDPRGTEVTAVHRVRVRVDEILMDAATPFQAWYVYIGINGRWHVSEGLNVLVNSANPLNYAVDLDLHYTDRVHITACGFVRNDIHRLMGRDLSLSWAEVSFPDNAHDNAEKIRGGFLSLGLDLASEIENQRLGTISSTHSPHPLEPVTVASTDGVGYQLRYRVIDPR